MHKDAPVQNKAKPQHRGQHPLYIDNTWDDHKTDFWSLHLLLRKDNYMQACALAEPSGPWRLSFALGQLEFFFFSYKSYAGHPRFYSFGALGSL